MKLFLTPQLSQVSPTNGIGQVVLAQFRYLPEFDVELVNDPRVADVIACHAGAGVTDRMDVVHLHGLYWTGDHNGTQFINWHHRVNRKVIETIKKARLVTVPSSWAGECLRRDMRIDPIIMGHGIDLADWAPSKGRHGGYVLWNKNRGSDVCDPTPAWELASRGVQVVSTFGAAGKPEIPELKIIGLQPFEEMKSIIKKAEIYLATTQETFGIGTLEAMASGVPILGYRWGGTLDLVEHKVNGYLVEPGNFEGLKEGYEWLRANRKEIREACLDTARFYDWRLIMQHYAELYREQLTPEPTGLAVVITNHNYAQYVGQAISSALNQTDPPEELIIVDDGSTDNSREVIDHFLPGPTGLDEFHLAGYKSKVKLIFQENKGVAAARNNGIAATRQPFIICLDADDRLDAAYVDTVRKALIEDRSLGVAYTALVMLYEDGSEHFGDWPPQFNWEAQATPHVPPNNCIPSAAAFRRSMWERSGGYRQVYAPGEDAEFWTRGLSLGFNARLVSMDTLFEYRVHKSSASREKTYSPIDIWLPWMNDKQYPMGAPSRQVPEVRSYALPVISVIIPVGPGHLKYLQDSIESLLGQTFREWEAIVIDDSGEPFQAWQSFLKLYPFIKLIHTHEPGSGAGAARNAGLTLASAPLVLFLDADDYLVPVALEKMLEVYKQVGQYVFTDYLALKENGQMDRMAVMNYDRSTYLETRQIHSVTALIPKAWIQDVGGFDESLPGWEEYDFFMKMAINGYCGTHLADSMFVYRLHTGQRRQVSQAIAKKLTALFEKRFPGGVPMSQCCGGNADSILAAKKLINGGNEMTQSLENIPPGAGMLRLEFVGDWEGPVLFKANGREYRGANHPAYKYLDAPPEDARILVGTGKFRVKEYAQAEAKPAPRSVRSSVQQSPVKAAAPAVEDLPELDESLNPITPAPKKAPTRAPKTSAKRKAK